MKNEQRSNLQFIQQITDISKMDLAGLNEITGYKDPEEETSGIEDLESLAREMQDREEKYEVCQFCGEEAGLVEIESGNVCDACLDQIEKEEEAIRKANEMNDNEIGDWWDWKQNHANK